MESAPPQPATLANSLSSLEAEWTGGGDELLDGLWREADGPAFALERGEFAQALRRAGETYNFNLPSGALATAAQAESFWRGLRLRELALVQACALGREDAWRVFLAEYRDPLTRAAVAITGSSGLGQDLAESLYSDLYGLKERDGLRRSPLLSYSGRGSLLGWLRTTLAQRHVDHHRRTHREAPLADQDFAAAEAVPAPQETSLTALNSAVATSLRELDAEERFMLSAWFLDGRTLQQIARLLRVHEATVSRRIRRLTETLRRDLLRNLQAGGLSRRAAEEALGADPRDLSLNLRTLLQDPQSSTFYEQEPPRPATDAT